jgi:CPA2 family monovalent cation:H+ antiporter-2
MNSLLGIIEIFYIFLGGFIGHLIYFKFNIGVGIYIIMGLLLGPAFLNLVTISYLSNTLSSIGILFVLFEIGLHLNYDKIISLKEYLFSSFSSIFLSIFTISIFLYYHIPNIYILIAILICISSTPLIFHLLKEKNQINSKGGKFVFVTMILQDILSIILLVNNTSSNHIVSTIIISIIILITLGLIGKKIINNFLKRFASSEFILLISILLIIGLSLLTEYLGLSLELGAVLAGYLLAGTEYVNFIESQIIPVKQMLLCLFFMTIGMYFPFSFMISHIYESFLLFLLIMICKFIGLYIGARFFLNHLQSLKASLMLLSVGEVIFIFINKIFPNINVNLNILNYLTIITVLSLIITPIILQIFYYVYEEDFLKPVNNQNEKFIIVGYNKITHIIMEVLNKANIDYICLEKNLEIINFLSKNNNIFNIQFINYDDIKILKLFLANSKCILFSSNMDFEFLKQVKKIYKKTIYMKIFNIKDKYKYKEIGIIPIYINSYDEAYKVCEIINEDLTMEINDLENIFISLKN